MPLSFDKYRFTDGKTSLSAATFNPRFQDLDLRLAAVEALKVSWEAAVQALTDFGLVRLDSVLSPTFAALNQDVADANARVASITQAQADALSAVAQWQSETLAAITAWENALKATALAVLNSTSLVAGDGKGGFAPVAVGTGLRYAGGNLSVPTLAWSTKSASFATSLQNGYYVSSSGVTATLAPGVADGDQVLFLSGLNSGATFTILPAAGQTVMGDTALSVDCARVGFALVYFASNADWRIF